MRRSIPLVLAAAVSLVVAPGAQATFPGEDGLIVFEASTEDGTQLFTIRPDGTDIRQITHVVPDPNQDDAGASKPDWSPDGRTIVFGENFCRIALIAAEGSDLRHVPPEPPETAAAGHCESDPSFTPDGLSIVYNRYAEGIEAVWIVKPDGTDRRLVTDACGIDPNVSPDGTRLSCRGRDDALWVVNMDGTGAVRVSPPDVIGWKHDWAPDGSALVFSQHPTPDQNANIATVAPDGSGLRWLTDYDPDTGARVGSFSPDGGSIVFRLTKDETQHALARMAADGTGVVQLTEYSATWPGLDVVGFNDEHYPEFDWGPAPAD